MATTRKASITTTASKYDTIISEREYTRLTIASENFIMATFAIFMLIMTIIYLIIRRFFKESILRATRKYLIIPSNKLLYRFKQKDPQYWDVYYMAAQEDQPKPSYSEYLEMRPLLIKLGVLEETKWIQADVERQASEEREFEALVASALEAEALDAKSGDAKTFEIGSGEKRKKKEGQIDHEQPAVDVVPEWLKNIPHGEKYTKDKKKTKEKPKKVKGKPTKAKG